MSVIVSSYPSSTNIHPYYFSKYHLNGNYSLSTKHRSTTDSLTLKFNENNHDDIDNDRVPFGVVNSMKQRLLDKANESLLLNSNSSTLIQHSLSKSSLRMSSNENLLQTKSSTLSLKYGTRLSSSQDSLLNNRTTEQLASYMRSKQDVIIVDKKTFNDENVSIHRPSYAELHVDEIPKPGM